MFIIYMFLDKMKNSTISTFFNQLSFFGCMKLIHMNYETRPQGYKTNSK